MLSAIHRYIHWLHCRWPAGTVEKLPGVGGDGQSSVPGLYIVGDLTGIPLLKFSADSGARAVQHLARNPEFQQARNRDNAGEVIDVAIIGAGISGMAAALEARKLGLSSELLEATEPFSTIVNFPRAKPIFTYPTEMVPAGELRFTADAKEPLVSELKAQTLEQGIEPRRARAEKVNRRGDAFEVTVSGQEPLRARRVVVGIGRSGNFRKLGVPGEDLDKVYNRLHDPRDFAGQDVLVVGGGDSAIETTIAMAQAGARVTLSYRKPEFSRPKPENVEKLAALQADPAADVAVEEPASERVGTATGAFLADTRSQGQGSVQLMMSSQVKAIGADTVDLRGREGRQLQLANDAVFSMIGREAPLDFFRRSGVAIRGEWRARQWASLALVLLAAVFVYHWKTDAGIPIKHWFQQAGWFPFSLARPDNGSSLWGTIRISATQPSFYYSLAYCLAVVGFGWRRIRRRNTPYVRRQTATLASIQCLPLFLLPYVLLPWAGHNGWFEPGAALQPVADALFPVSQWSEHGREYWRALGLILAWPLFFWNTFTDQPMGVWLAIGAVQTFVVIPLLVYFWGKGAYCGWICSCGALAETMGDAQRHKMPHGPGWNRLNMAGQVVLLLALGLLVLRTVSWWLPETGWLKGAYMGLFLGRDAGWGSLSFPLSFANYVWSVDLLLAGILGVGLYWHFSGRVWCRFVCPLAALMHIHARFSRFRILADKKKCISCNVCTSVCHQGIDVMNFANKGVPMADPECVRCSACVESCPTGVLQFGQVEPGTGRVMGVDGLPASRVRMSEGS